MLTLFKKTFNGKFKEEQHCGPKTWLVSDLNSSDKKFIINQYVSQNNRAKDSYSLNRKLFKSIKEAADYFIKYEEMIEVGGYLFIRIEYCQRGDLNSFVSENRFKTKPETDDKLGDWIIDLINAIIYLNQHNLIHTRLSTYTIFIASNGRLKIDGFENVYELDAKNPIFDLKSIKDSYGMFNSPELVKFKKMNSKYHIWCIGWIIYEITTCDWQHFKLLKENFDDWIAPSLPNSYSKSLNSLFKTMIRLSPIDRPSAETLLQMASNCIKKSPITVKKDDSNDSLGYGEMYIKNLDEKYKTDVKVGDDFEYFSDSEQSKSNTIASDRQLDFNEPFDEKNTEVKSNAKRTYKIKELIEKTEFYTDYVVKYSKNRYMLRKLISRRSEDNDKLNKIKEKSAEKNNAFVVFYYEYFPLDSARTLCYITEYFDEGTLDKLITRTKKDGKHFNEERVFDFIYFIVNGVEFLHKNKIVHFDINPKNIFLRNEKPKLGNIGLPSILEQKLAKINDENKSKKAIQEAEPIYYSPEFINQKDIGDHCDLWSVGCIMYELIQLEPLFTTRNIPDLKINHPTFKDTEASSKLKKINNYLFINAPIRPPSSEIIKEMKHFINKEKELYRNL